MLLAVFTLMSAATSFRLFVVAYVKPFSALVLIFSFASLHRSRVSSLISVANSFRLLPRAFSVFSLMSEATSVRLDVVTYVRPSEAFFFHPPHQPLSASLLVVGAPSGVVVSTSGEVEEGGKESLPSTPTVGKEECWGPPSTRGSRSRGRSSILVVAGLEDK